MVRSLKQPLSVLRNRFALNLNISEFLPVRYMEIPPISRLYLTGAFLTTAACAVDLISPFSLYFSWELVYQGQIWRLLTSYLFFGVFSVDFLFHMYFLVSNQQFYSYFASEGLQLIGPIHLKRSDTAVY